MLVRASAGISGVMWLWAHVYVCCRMPTPYAEQPSMNPIKTYSTRVEADLARLALEAAGIPSTVVGISAGMEGGVAGVQLLVPDDRVEAALTLLKDA